MLENRVETNANVYSVPGISDWQGALELSFLGDEGVGVRMPMEASLASLVR